MHYRITSLVFDFDDSASYDKDPGYFAALYEDYIGTVWEADDGDDLVEEITASSGWCVKHIDYIHVLQPIQ